MKGLQVKFFGGFQVLVDGQPLTSQLSDKSLALFGFLVQESGHAHRRERLAGLFWPETPETLARHSLSQALFSLNQAFRLAMDQSPFLITPHSIQIKAGLKISVDTLEFDESLQLCEALERDQAPASVPYLQSLQQAVALYKGEFWAGFFLADCNAFEDWLEQTRVGYHQKIWRSANRLVEYLALVGRYEKALEYAYRLIELDRLSEEGHRKVMHLLALMNRHAEAITHFQAYRQYLREELDTEPGDDINASHDHLLHEPTRIELPAVPVTNLPAALAPIIGRQAELQQLVDLLSSPAVRLVTVLGSGGAGKTRLALEAGWKLVPAFAHGVFLAEANSHLAKEALLAAIASGVGLDVLLGPVTHPFLTGNTAQEPILQEQLTGFLRGKEMLLVLDGLEQVQDGSSLLQHLLNASPRLKILATSRVRMDLEGENVFVLEGLPYPPAVDTAPDPGSYSAVQLFVHSARRNNQNFALTPHNREAVAEICRMLEGIPLGILQASAWELALDTTAILRELRQNSDFLSEGWLKLPDRQRSLRASFEYSWNLLKDPEKKAFLGLSIFRNTFHLERAIHVCGISLHTIKVLIDHSFLLYRGEGLYRMHDLLREFAFEQLKALPEEMSAIRQKFIQEYLEGLVAWHEKLKSPEQFEVIDEMTFEHSNIRSAWDMAIDGGETGLLEKALPGLCWFYRLSCRYKEGLSLCRQTGERIWAGERSPQNSILVIDLQLWQASFLALQGNNQPALQILQPIVNLLENEKSVILEIQERLAFAYQILAETLSNIDPGEASIQAVKSFQLYQIVEDPWNMAFSLLSGAICTHFLGNSPQSLQLARQAWEIHAQHESPYLGSAIKTQLAYCYMMLGESQNALDLAQELVHYHSKINSPYSQVYSWTLWGTALHHAGLYDEALPILQDGLKASQDLGLFAYSYFINLLLGTICVFTGKYNEGVEKLENLSEASRIHDPLASAIIGAAFIARDELALAKDYLARSIVEYEPWVRKDQAGVPLALSSLAASLQGNWSKARALLVEALKYAVQFPAYSVFQLSLAATSLLMIEKGNLEQAVELYALVSSHPTVKNSPLWADVYLSQTEAHFAGLPGDTLQLAREHGSQQNLYEVGQHILSCLQKNPDWL